eukprot:TRINITY_DN26024_c0_g1_i1.p1 TRINITY_DN26024_c0_g1~~TRINITY_DN26024_c0_g1_i1.p1  ORF type:complete len:106 (+),score=24.18 TRINITY_DN26024_c0_g1_i1:671-988(+)
MGQQEEAQQHIKAVLEQVDTLLSDMNSAGPGPDEVHPSVRLKLMTAQTLMKRNEALRKLVEGAHKTLAESTEKAGKDDVIENTAVALHEMDTNIAHIVRIYASLV